MDSKKPMSEEEKLQRQILLRKDLVEIYDPESDNFKQIPLDMAKRMAKVRPDVAKLLDDLDVPLDKEEKE